MTTGFLTKLIDGRASLPVRAIPYVTGWTISPDEVAKDLARTTEPAWARLQNIFAYHRPAGTPVLVRPKEWRKCVARFDAFEAKLRSAFPESKGEDQYRRAYAVWLDEAMQELPAGWFVWLDDFMKSFHEALSPDAVTIEKEQPGDRDLIFTPAILGMQREVVLEGFEADPDFDPGPDQRHVDEEGYSNKDSTVGSVDPILRRSFGEVPFPAPDNGRQLTGSLPADFDPGEDVLLPEVIAQLERELEGLVERVSDPMLRGMLAGQKAEFLSAADIADAIQHQRLDGTVSYDSNGMFNPARSFITASGLETLRASLHRNSNRIASIHEDGQKTKAETAPESDSNAFIFFTQTWPKLQIRFPDSTHEEVAGWIWLGAESGGFTAFSKDGPDLFTRFSFEPRTPPDNQADADYVSPVRRLYFLRADIAAFEPRDRFLRAGALIARWGKRLGYPPEVIIQTMITERRLTDIHPILVGTKWSEPNIAWRAPKETALFRLSEIEKIEAEGLLGEDADAVAMERELPSIEQPVIDESAQEELRQADDPKTTKLRKRIVLDRLAATYPMLRRAWDANDPELASCRVPPERAPRNKSGYYYLEKVEAVCVTRWSPKATAMARPPSMQNLGAALAKAPRKI